MIFKEYQQKPNKLLKSFILQYTNIYLHLKKNYLIEINLKQEFAMNGMHYNVGVQIIGTIFLSKKLFGEKSQISPNLHLMNMEIMLLKQLLL